MAGSGGANVTKDGNIARMKRPSKNGSIDNGKMEIIKMPTIAQWRNARLSSIY